MLEKYKHELSETKGITAQLKNSREALNNRVKIQLLNWWKTELIKLSRKHRANENGKYKNHFRDEEDRMGKSNIFPPRIPEGKQRENIKEAIFAFLFFFFNPSVPCNRWRYHWTNEEKMRQYMQKCYQEFSRNDRRRALADAWHTPYTKKNK